MLSGNKGWADWILEEEESMEHFKVSRAALAEGADRLLTALFPLVHVFRALLTFQVAWEAGINTWGEILM